MTKDTGFFQKACDVASKIPYGRVTSYGAIAMFLGSKKSARMVGWAMNSTKNQYQNIPAHRVVNKSGLLTGSRHFGGVNTMAELLSSEGIIIENNKIINFDEKFWDPNLEL